jgi:hypothetical protein
MRKFLLTTVALVALATPALAFYTESTVTKEMSLQVAPMNHLNRACLSTKAIKLRIDKVIKVGGMTRYLLMRRS